MMNKHAGFLMNAAKFGGGFAVPYIASAHYQNKINNGEQVGLLGRTIANNAGKIGLVTGAAAVNPSAAYGAVKTVVGDSAKGIKKLFQKKQTGML